MSSRSDKRGLSTATNSKGVATSKLGWGSSISQWMQSSFSSSTNNCLNLESDDQIVSPLPALEDSFIHLPISNYRPQGSADVNKLNNEAKDTKTKPSAPAFLTPSIVQVANKFAFENSMSTAGKQSNQSLASNMSTETTITNDIGEHFGRRRNSVSLPSSPQTSPKVHKKKYVNRYFASPFVENENLPNHSSWLRSTLFAVRDKNYYSSEDLNKGGLSAQNYQISAEYRELNLASPISM